MYRLTIFVSSSENLELKEREKRFYYVVWLERVKPLAPARVLPHMIDNHLQGRAAASLALE